MCVKKQTTKVELFEKIKSEANSLAVAFIEADESGLFSENEKKHLNEKYDEIRSLWSWAYESCEAEKIIEAVKKISQFRSEENDGELIRDIKDALKVGEENRK